MNNNDEKVKEMLENEEVPEQLSPENIKEMLDEKAPKKKRLGISVAGRITATVAACALIVGTTIQTTGFLKNKDKAYIGDYTGDYSVDESGAGNNTGNNTDDNWTGKVDYQVGTDAEGHNFAYVTENNEQAKAPYMSGAESYEQIYKLIEKSGENRKKVSGGLLQNNIYGSFDVMEEAAVEEDYTNDIASAAPAADGGSDDLKADYSYDTDDEDIYFSESAEENPEYSDTYNQEENVLEADIVKTDGKKIYYIKTGYYDYPYSASINIAEVKDGQFVDSMQLDVSPEIDAGEGWEYSTEVSDMYLYNDMIAVIGTTYGYQQTVQEDEEYYNGCWNDCYYYEHDERCFVSFYTKDAELIGTYWQDGFYHDVRIAPDGFMYLTSTYDSEPFYYIDDMNDIEKYIPECGIDEDFSCMPPEDILLPENELDNDYNLSYTIIGSIDLTVSEQFTPTDTKALAGYTGNLYCSADNIYTTVGWQNTEITRISVSGGEITPMASGTVEGVVKDQFSMSEYDGYFRIATTVNKWIDHGNFITDALGIYRESEHIQDNRVYILDMDMNTVGSVEGFGKDESIKSVNFSGDMAYVVTYRQTDPLFAIDLSNPAEPFITDEYKILGYSTYMQKWADGLLLGFGADADERGVETGVKLVMFDNSDPYDLKEVGLYPMFYYSSAKWERKALLIAPEKNLIGVPLTEWNYETGNVSKYMFFEYTDGEFILRGEISKDMPDYRGNFERAVYIGDYVYALSENSFVAADIETITVTDEIYFD